MTAGSYCYIGPQGIVHGTMVGEEKSCSCRPGSGSVRASDSRLSVIKFQHPFQ